MQAIEKLEQRLGILERRVRNHRRWSIACTLLCLIVLLCSLRNTPSTALTADEVVTRELRVIDEEGLTRAVLGRDLDRPRAVSLRLTAKVGREAPSAILRVDEEEAWCELGGFGVPASVWLTGDRKGANVSLLTRADEQDTAKHGVVRLSASDGAGSLSLCRVHLDDAETSSDSPPGTKVVTWHPVLNLSPENEYRHVVR